MEKTDDIGVWSANETVYSAGNTPEFNYLVIEGDVNITAPNGFFRRCGSGRIIWRSLIYTGTKRSTTVIAGSNGLKAKLIPPGIYFKNLKKTFF